MFPVAGAVFGDRYRIERKRIEQAGEPQGHGARQLDFHDDGAVWEQESALVSEGQVEMVGAVADPLVERDAHAGIGPVEEGRPVIGEVGRRLEGPASGKPVDFLEHLAGGMGFFSCTHIACGRFQGKRYPPFEHLPFIFLFQLQVDRIGRFWDAISAQPQFLLIYRLFQAGTDQVVGRRVVVQASNGVLPVGVGLRILPQRGEERTEPDGTQAVFQFHSFEDGRAAAHRPSLLSKKGGNPLGVETIIPQKSETSLKNPFQIHFRFFGYSKGRKALGPCCIRQGFVSR